MQLELFISGAALLLAVSVLWNLYGEVTSPLRTIKGPALARWTRFWYFYRVARGRFELDNIALHRKYGKIVRVAPNHFSIDDPSAIKTIYGIGTAFTKSAWYAGFSNPGEPRSSIFPERDIKRHAEDRRRFQSLYSMTSIAGYEPFVDECADLLTDHLNEFAETNKKVNMAHWFQCYAFDVIGNITYGKRFGFLDHGEDIQGMISAISSHMRYSALVGIFVEWHPILFRQMQRLKRSGASGRLFLMQFVQKMIGDRMKQNK